MNYLSSEDPDHVEKSCSGWWFWDTWPPPAPRLSQHPHWPTSKLTGRNVISREEEEETHDQITVDKKVNNQNKRERRAVLLLFSILSLSTLCNIEQMFINKANSPLASFSNVAMIVVFCNYPFPLLSYRKKLNKLNNNWSMIEWWRDLNQSINWN